MDDCCWQWDEGADEQLGLGKGRMDSILIKDPFIAPLPTNPCSYPTCLVPQVGGVNIKFNLRVTLAEVRR